MRAASDVVRVLLDDIGIPNQRERTISSSIRLHPSQGLFTVVFLRHGPDAQRVFVTFASAFLIKVRVLPYPI